jgi:hypothetical protein
VACDPTAEARRRRPGNSQLPSRRYLANHQKETVKRRNPRSRGRGTARLANASGSYEGLSGMSGPPDRK